jgi:tripartite-type tricarboxylate transporter receptor subunit TctC
VAALHKAAVDALKDPDVISKLSNQGAILVGDTPDQFRAFIASETKKWAAVIKDAGVPVQR